MSDRVGPVPSVFRVEERLWGSCPDDFQAVELPTLHRHIPKSGDLHLLALAPFPTQDWSLYYRHVEPKPAYRIVHFGELNPGSPEKDVTEWKYLARDWATLIGGSPTRAKDVLLRWLRSGDWSLQSRALQILLAYPSLRNSEFFPLLEAGVRGETLKRIGYAQVLGAKPDARTRALAAELTRAEERAREAAVFLVAEDTTWAGRRLHRTLVLDESSTVRERAIEALRPSRFDADWVSLRAALAQDPPERGLTAARRKLQAVPERLRSLRMLEARNSLPKYAFNIPLYITGPDWSAEELWSAMFVVGPYDESRTRRAAYREVGRRSEPRGVAEILRRLRVERLPDGSEIMISEAREMIKALAAARDPKAVSDLLLYTEVRDHTARELVYFALGSIGDSRALARVRTAAWATPCESTDLHFDQGLLYALVRLGGSEELELLNHWLSTCPGYRMLSTLAIAEVTNVNEALRMLDRAIGSPEGPDGLDKLVKIESAVRRGRVVAHRWRQEIRLASTLN